MISTAEVNAARETWSRLLKRWRQWDLADRQEAQAAFHTIDRYLTQQLRLARGRKQRRPEGR